MYGMIRNSSIEISIPSWYWNSPYRITWCKRDVRFWLVVFWFIEAIKTKTNMVLLKNLNTWFNSLNFVAALPMFNNTTRTFFGTGCCLLCYPVALLVHCAVAIFSMKQLWRSNTIHESCETLSISKRKAWNITWTMCTYHLLRKWESTLP